MDCSTTKTDKVYLSWDEVFELLSPYDHAGKTVYGIPKGGMILAGFLKWAKPTHDPKKADYFLDDIIDSGHTKGIYADLYPGIPFHALITKLRSNAWFVFPWEKDHPSGEDNVQQNIIRQIQYIGDDPTREGLLGTPDRVIRSWKELFSGYGKDPKDIMTVFDSDGYDQIVLLKDIEVYSCCEHHMLPFYGQASVAYIPNGKVIGISKLARLVEIYARRLQIQERLGEQITNTLMEYLQPLGAACIIECRHLCMMARGISKQNSVMKTSSLKGVFFTKPEARMELMELLK